MTEKLVGFFVKLFGGNKNSEIGKIAIIAILSMLPVIELRGGLIAAALLNLEGLLSFIICYIYSTSFIRIMSIYYSYFHSIFWYF